MIKENYILGKNYKDFKLIKKEFVKEEDSEVLFFEHNQTKAQIIKILNKKEDLGFCIGFKTPPNNSKGIPHIIEHSVLKASKKYNHSDSFYQLYNSSILSFLNAFTYPDKTLFIFSSPSKEEYFKIMDVYLDFVFNPLFLEKEKIFYNEGWRYEYKDKIELNKLFSNSKSLRKINKKDFSVSGIVLNEMLGIYSSPKDLLNIYTRKTLFSRSIYAEDAGGDPMAIIDLSYKELKDFYNKYYHPSNSYICLYGNADLLQELDLLSNYLNKYDYRKYIFSVPSYKKENKKFISHYESQNPETDLFYVSYSFELTEISDYYNYFILIFLCYLLFENTNSPVREKLSKTDIFENFLWEIDTEICKPSVSLIFYGVKKNSVLELKKLILKSFQDLIKKEFERDFILGILNQFEISLKEDNSSKEREPHSIKTILEIYSTWLFEGDPILPLKSDFLFNKLKSEINNHKNLFQNLIERYFLNSLNSSFVILKPKKCSLRDKIKVKIHKRIEKFSHKQLLEVIRNISKFNSISDKENDFPFKLITLNSLKDLSLKNISVEYRLIQNKISNFNQLKRFERVTNLKDLNILTFYFNSNIPYDELPFLNILITLLNRIKTINYDTNTFSNLIAKNTNGLNFNIKIIGKTNPKLFLNLELTFLTPSSKQIILIVNELFNNVIFEKSKIKEILLEIKSNLEINFLENGSLYALLRNGSEHSLKYKIQNKLFGVEMYKSIKSLLKLLEKSPEKILKKIIKVYQSIFTKNNLEIVSLLKDKLQDLNINDFIEKLNFERDKRLTTNYSLLNNINKNNKNVGIPVNSSVLYNALGCNFREFSKLKYSGKIYLLEKSLYSYVLINEIRSKGSAYGVIDMISRDGDLYFISYRDPHLKRTLKIFRDVFTYIDKIDEEKLFNSKIVIFSKFLYPDDENFKFKREILRYLENISREDIILERKEILSANLKEIKDLAVILRQVYAKATYCSLGEKKRIIQNKELFNEITYL